MEIRDGQFGENLTTAGIDVNEAEVGERWLVEDAVLEVASVRIPCNGFKVWMGALRVRRAGVGQAVHRGRRPSRPLSPGAHGGVRAGDGSRSRTGPARRHGQPRCSGR